MLLSSWLRSVHPTSQRHRSKRPQPCRLQVEPLEDRTVPSADVYNAGLLFVFDSVIGDRYDE